MTHPVMRRLPVVVAMFAVMVAAILFAPLVGSTSISLAHAFDRSIPFDQNVDAQIFFIARLPRVLAAALVGGTLAAAGVIFQGLLRNPLATPYTLGVSTGSALGAMLAITFGASLPFVGVTTASLAGSMIAVPRVPSETIEKVSVSPSTSVAVTATELGIPSLTVSDAG